MKKFLIAVICIIPVIVVLALSVTGDIILQVTAENPNALKIFRFDDSEVGDGDTIEIDINNTDDYLTIEVLPGFVQNKNIVWRLTEEEGMDGKISLKKMEGSSNRYWLCPEEPGVCVMEIRPEGNIDVVKTINFHITTIEVQRFEVYRADDSEPVATDYGANGKGEPLSRTVTLKGAERFYTSATPFSAYQVLDGNETEWSIGVYGGGDSDGEDAEASDYLCVDDTGWVTPLRRADATIAVNVYLKSDKAGNSFLATFWVDLSEVLVKTTEAVCLETGKSADGMTAWVKNNLVLSDNAEVKLLSHDGDVWRFNISESVRLASRDAGTDGSVTVTVIETDRKWGVSSIPAEIYAGNGNVPYYVVDYTTIDYAGGKVTGEIISDYTVASRNTDILQVDRANGLLKPQKAGVATLEFSHNGETVALQVTVKERPVSFALSLNSADASRGIARNRLWGNYWLDADNSELVSEFEFGLGAQYATGAFEVAWSVSAVDPTGVPVEDEELGDYITIVPKEHGYEGVTLIFGEKSAGSKITVTAKLYMQNRIVDSVQRNFTFEMVEKRNSVNVYDFEDFKAVYKMPTYDYVLQNDIRAAAVSDDFLYDADVGGESTRGDNVFPNMMGSIYGNGYLYDATDVKVTKNDQGALSYRYELMVTKLREMYKREHDGVTPDAAQLKAYFAEKGLDEIDIYNLKMRGAETLEESDNTLSVLCYALGYYQERDIDSNAVPRDPPMAIRYCEVYNSERGIALERVNDVLIEGCILGDNYKHSVFGYNHTMLSRRYPNYYDGDRAKVNANTDDNRPGYNITLKNNVFKRSSGPAVCLAGTSPTEGENWDDYSVSPNFHIEGDMEIYNWKTREQFRQAIIDLITYYVLSIVARDGTSDELETVEDLISSMLENVVDSFLDLPANDKLYYYYGGEKYIGLGLFGAGCVYAWDPADTHISQASSADVIMSELRLKNADGTLPDALRTVEEDLIPIFNVPGFKSVSESCWMLCNNFSSGSPEITPDDPVSASEDMYDKLTAGDGDPMPWDKYTE